MDKKVSQPPAVKTENSVFSKYMVSGSLILFLCLLVYGCTVKTYTQTRDRVDQDISGVKPSQQPHKTRKVYTLEVQPKPLRNPFASPDAACPSEKLPGEIKPVKENDKKKTAPQIKIEAPVAAKPVLEPAAVSFVFPLQHTVAQGETLQSISKKYYDTYRKWPKIFEANQDKMKTSDHIEAGMILTIPQP